MKTTSYIIITRRSGKRKVYRTEKYLLLRRIKLVGAIVAAIVTTLLFCGMTITEKYLLMPVQIMFFSAFGVLALVFIIYSYIDSIEPQKSKTKNRKGEKEL